MTFTPTGGVSFAAPQTVPAPQVLMKTTMGDMLIELDPAKAPLSVDNFLQYVHDGFYTNLIFHRVIANFVTQGGGFDANLKQVTPRAPIKLESANGLSNLRGTIAMARTSEPNSATSQFYFNNFDNLSLDGKVAGVDGYAVFGKLVAGLNVLDAIRVVPTTSDVPVTPVIITAATQTQ
ncbi:MAG: peptidylprolyl isomerase [Burkholderiales bacterium]|nr:peptidylprolyl isomerase [Burkholderiales bacterium]